MVHRGYQAFLLLIATTIWLFVLITPGKDLSIIACDVGEGDAILIQKGLTQVLIDGGPNSKVLDCLGKFMPLADRRLELVILTHPELDHFGGLIDVFKYYNVDNFAEYNQDSGSQEYKVLKSLVGGSKTRVFTLTQGVVVRLGMIYLDILNPIPGQVSSNRNNDGVVALLRFQNFKALLPADVENKVSDRLALDYEIQNIDYIKVNHHGSKNGLTEKLLQATKPRVAVISVGKNNRYKHPSPEIMELLNKFTLKILRTDEQGSVVVQTDGNKFWVTHNILK